MHPDPNYRTNGSVGVGITSGDIEVIERVVMAAADIGDREEVEALTDPVVIQLSGILMSIFPNHVWDDDVMQTAKRVVKSWREFAPTPDPRELPFKFTTFAAEKGQLVVVRDIEFTSMCAHHLLPYYGVAHFGYVPHKYQVGLSKIPRLVQFRASQPTVQENLTAGLVKEFSERLDTRDVMLVVEARHTCMSCRGVRAHTASMSTSLPKGAFFTSEALRNEFFSLIGRRTF